MLCLSVNWMQNLALTYTSWINWNMQGGFHWLDFLSLLLVHASNNTHTGPHSHADFRSFDTHIFAFIYTTFVYLVRFLYTTFRLGFAIGKEYRRRRLYHHSPLAIHLNDRINFNMYFFSTFRYRTATPIVQNVSWLWIMYCKIFAMFI